MPHYSLRTIAVFSSVCNSTILVYSDSVSSIFSSLVAFSRFSALLSFLQYSSYMRYSWVVLLANGVLLYIFWPIFFFFYSVVVLDIDLGLYFCNNISTFNCFSDCIFIDVYNWRISKHMHYIAKRVQSVGIWVILLYLSFWQ